MWALAVLVTCTLQSLSIQLSRPHQSLYCLSKLPVTEASRPWEVPKGIEPSGMVCVPQGSKPTYCPGNSQLHQGYWEFSASCPLNHLPGPHRNLPRLSPKLLLSSQAFPVCVYDIYLGSKTIFTSITLDAYWISLDEIFIPVFCNTFVSQFYDLLLPRFSVLCKVWSVSLSVYLCSWWKCHTSRSKDKTRWRSLQYLVGASPKHRQEQLLSSKSQNITRDLPSTPSIMFRACQVLSHPYTPTAKPETGWLIPEGLLPSNGHSGDGSRGQWEQKCHQTVIR